MGAGHVQRHASPHAAQTLAAEAGARALGRRLDVGAGEQAVGTGAAQPGQLDAEIRTGAWVVIGGSDEDVFSDDPAGLWRRTLARQGGRLAWLADAPDDLDLN